MHRAMMMITVLMAIPALAFVLAPDAHAQAATPEVAAPSQSSTTVGWGLIAAAISVGAACIGAGIAVSAVGAAAIGAIAEKPELAARTLIFVGLAEGIAIYGLIIAIMILGRI